MKLLLCGDLVPTAATVPSFEAGDVRALMGDVTGLTARVDYAVANLECALTNSETRIRKCGPNLKGKPEYAKVIADAGFAYLGLSNNHVLDFGIQGMRDTVEAVYAAGMIPFGFGENDQDSRTPLFIENNRGECVAIVAVCEHEYTYALGDQFGANPFDPFDTMEDIARAKEKAGHVIVMYHGGKEQCEYPSPRLRKACRAMVRAGADLVICQHSHCVGCRESYQGKEIVYGEGNFNFVGHSDSDQWKCGLVAEVELGEEIRIEYHPVVTTDCGVTLAKGAEKEAILESFRERSEILQQEELWLAKWGKFCRSLPYYPDAVKNAYTDIPEGELCQQVFPHYLDCEAHLDVWKTIYRTWHAEKTSGA